MRLWAATIIYIYAGVQLFNWVTGLHWLSDFTWPMTIVAGFGLAIASQPATSMVNTSDPHPPSSAISELTDLTQELPTASKAMNEGGTGEGATDVASSISFTIRKNVRPQ